MADSGSKKDATVAGDSAISCGTTRGGIPRAVFVVRGFELEAIGVT